MEAGSPENPQISKFKSIPHLNLTDLLPLKDLIIVKPLPVRQSAKRKRPLTKNSTKNLERELKTKKHVTFEESLSDNFRKTSVTPRDFRERYSGILGYLEELGRLSSNIEIGLLKNGSSDSKTFDPEKISKLKVSAGLNRILRRNLRIPTISEIITTATNMNLKEVKSLDGNFTINVEAEDNKWSDLNLFRFFKNSVKLHTYQLVCGGLEYSCSSVPHDAHKRFLLSGPKCDIIPLVFHKRATENYFKNNSDTNVEIVDENEPIVTISFYHNVRGHKYREFDILSFQTLANLTDSFKCSSQIVSEDFDLGIKGSCYMINGVLYPDLRDGACDYSENLLDFYKNEKTGVLRSHVPIIQENAIISNIEFKLYDSGYFLHYGDCEHRVEVTRVRIFDRSRDCPYVKCYPLCTFTPNQHRTDCQVCETNEATKTVFNSLLLPNNPSNLCKECYSSFKKVKLGSDIYFDKGLNPSIAIEYNKE